MVGKMYPTEGISSQCDTNSVVNDSTFLGLSYCIKTARLKLASQSVIQVNNAIKDKMIFLGLSGFAAGQRFSVHLLSCQYLPANPQESQTQQRDQTTHKLALRVCSCYTVQLLEIPFCFGLRSPADAPDASIPSLSPSVCSPGLPLSPPSSPPVSAGARPPSAPPAVM